MYAVENAPDGTGPASTVLASAVPASVAEALRLVGASLDYLNSAATEDLDVSGCCAWPGGCDRPASACDVHHIRHKGDGGETSVANCGLFCQFHHDVCIHRWGWNVVLHPDGTWTAVSPDGRQTLYSHAPPGSRAA